MKRVVSIFFVLLPILKQITWQFSFFRFQNKISGLSFQKKKKNFLKQTEIKTKTFANSDYGIWRRSYGKSQMVKRHNQTLSNIVRMKTNVHR